MCMFSPTLSKGLSSRFGNVTSAAQRSSVNSPRSHCRGRPSTHTCFSDPGFHPLASLCDSVTLLDHQAGRTELATKLLIAEGSKGSSTWRKVRSRFKSSSITHKP